MRQQKANVTLFSLAVTHSSTDRIQRWRVTLSLKFTPHAPLKFYFKKTISLASLQFNKNYLLYDVRNKMFHFLIFYLFTQTHYMLIMFTYYFQQSVVSGFIR